MSQAEGSSKAKVVRGERCVVLQHLLKTLMQRVRQDGAHVRMGWGGGARAQPGLQAARRKVDLILRALGSHGWILSRGGTGLELGV